MKIIAGNWKMNGTPETLAQMVNALTAVQTKNRVILCVPYTLLGRAPASVAIAAQDVSAHDRGAFTGEVSASMVAATGAKYTLVGHSERRQYHGETNEIVRHKAEMAIAAGLWPIICVGETMDERNAGKTSAILESGVMESVPARGDIIVAYEPRWAIGAGITPTDDEIVMAHELIAKTLNKMGRADTPILYGASVRAHNAAQIMSLKNVAGVLVGGASLKPDDFIPIITSVE